MENKAFEVRSNRWRKYAKSLVEYWGLDKYENVGHTDMDPEGRIVEIPDKDIFGFIVRDIFERVEIGEKMPLVIIHMGNVIGGTVQTIYFDDPESLTCSVSQPVVLSKAAVTQGHIKNILETGCGYIIYEVTGFNLTGSGEPRMCCVSEDIRIVDIVGEVVSPERVFGTPYGTRFETDDEYEDDDRDR